MKSYVFVKPGKFAGIGLQVSLKMLFSPNGEMKLFPTESEIGSLGREALSGTLARIPGLRARDHEWVGRPSGPPTDPGYDFRQRIETADGTSWWLYAAMKATGYPRQVRSALWGLQRSVARENSNGGAYPLVIAPFLSPDSTALCEEEDAGYLDLSGNCHLSFGSVHHHVEGKPNQFKDRRGIKTLFSPKTSRILRILLQGPLREHRVEDLAREAAVSIGLVSKVRKHLLEEDLADAGPGGLRITKPESVLRDWTFSDDLSARTEGREYSILEQDHGRVARILHDSLDTTRHAFTQWTAAHLRAPHAPPQVTSAYVEDFPDEATFKKVLHARRVERGGRLRLFRPKDEGVFIAGQRIRGLPLVSDIQIYLDLRAEGSELRAGEAANELRALSDFSGGWV